MPYNLMEDKELFDRLHKADLAQKVKTHDDWALLTEARERIVDRAIAAFAMGTKADDLVRIIELQTIIKKYKYGLFDEIEQIAREGELVFNEMRDRDLLHKP